MFHAHAPAEAPSSACSNFTAGVATLTSTTAGSCDEVIVSPRRQPPVEEQATPQDVPERGDGLWEDMGRPHFRVRFVQRLYTCFQPDDAGSGLLLQSLRARGTIHVKWAGAPAESAPLKHSHPATGIAMTSKPSHDIAILGAGIAGSILAAILARNGARVIVIDAGSHPRFAIGESTIVATDHMLKIIGARYNVPEISWLGSWEEIAEHVSSQCGIKKQFGFVYHRNGERPRHLEAQQLVLPGIAGAGSHLFRQDIDSFVFHTAVKYGADFRLGTPVTDLAFDDDGVTLTTKRDETIRVRCLIDGTGVRSPFVRQLGLLNTSPNALRTRTRTLFTHMLGVRPFDECVGRGIDLGNPVPWHEGTLHHVFDGGWMWVIPFGNRPGSTNPLTSVGITLDLDKHPWEEREPEEEFHSFLSRFPAIAEQFRDAQAARPWIRTRRLQASTTASTRDRYCLLAHSSGFIGPLFSRGLAHSTEIINALGVRLLDAIRDDDFSASRFAYIEKMNKAIVQRNDELVSACYTSFRDFDLWNAMLRAWIMGQGTHEVRVIFAHLKFLETKQDRYIAELEEARHPGLLMPVLDTYAEFWSQTMATMDQVAAGNMSSAAASRTLFGLLKRHNLGPPFVDIGRPESRVFGPFSPKAMARSLVWLARKRTPELRSFHTRMIAEVAKAIVAGQLKPRNLV